MPQVTETDADVIRRVRQGNRDAYRVLVDRYAPMVFHILRSYCRDEADVEDLAQDTFVRAFENISRFREDAQFSSWLYRIAVNRGKDYVKSARQQRYDDGEVATMESEFCVTANPHTDVVAKERATMLRRALEELSPEYATAFTLKYEMGLPYKEMADVMNSTVGALKVRVHRARKQLRSHLEDKL